MRDIPSPTLRIIGTGFGPCDHMHESFAWPERFMLWHEAMRRKRAGESIDWRPLLDGFRATLDWPAAFFWRELAVAHPDAGVILTVRDPERWYESARSTIYAAAEARSATPQARLLYGLLAWLDPRARRGFRTVQETVWDGTFGGEFLDCDEALRIFAAHNREVHENVSADRLLVFDVRQGWKPLCAFLDVPVPANEPFPHVNDATDFTRRQQEQYRAIARALGPAVGFALAGGALGWLAGFSRERARQSDCD